VAVASVVATTAAAAAVAEAAELAAVIRLVAADGISLSAAVPQCLWVTDI
jgi:hypothetical protein